MRLGGVLYWVLGLFPSLAWAESLQASEGGSPTIQSELLAHFGVTSAPFEVPALHEAKGQAFVLLGRAVYQPSQNWEWQIQVPWVFGSVAQPAGSYVDASAMGNPQVGIRWWRPTKPLRRPSFAYSAGMELGPPLASAADDLMPNRLLAIADGIEGRRHPELFTPGALSFTPSVTLDLAGARFAVAAELRLPVLVRVSESHLSSHGATTHAIGLASSFGLEVRYQLSPRLLLAAASFFSLDLAPLTGRPPGTSRLQDMERLSLHVHVGARANLVVDLQAPLGGDLQGNTVAAGLGLALDLG